MLKVVPFDSDPTILNLEQIARAPAVQLSTLI